MEEEREPIEEREGQVAGDERAEEAAPEEVPSDQDRLLAGLAYVFGGIVSAIVLLTDNLREKPFLRYHAVQALGGWAVIVVYWVAVGILSLVVTAVLPCVACVLPIIGLLPCLALLYYAYLAYQGQYCEIPALTDFMKQQGWL